MKTEDKTIVAMTKPYVTKKELKRGEMPILEPAPRILTLSPEGSELDELLPSERHVPMMESVGGAFDPFHETYAQLLHAEGYLRGTGTVQTREELEVLRCLREAELSYFRPSIGDRSVEEDALWGLPEFEA